MIVIEAALEFPFASIAVARSVCVPCKIYLASQANEHEAAFIHIRSAFPSALISIDVMRASSFAETAILIALSPLCKLALAGELIAICGGPDMGCEIGSCTAWAATLGSIATCTPEEFVQLEPFPFVDPPPATNLVGRG